MLRPRIIPCLLVHQGGLFKTKLFKDPRYVGDPINAVRIFNEKEADELIVLDIDATVQRREPDFSLIAKLAAECQMPLCYGGGVTTVEHAVRLIDMGVEKVAIGTAAVTNPTLITEMVRVLGSQSIVAVLDVRKKKDSSINAYEICTHNASIVHELDPLNFALELQAAGVGEIVINSVDFDGLMKGYNIDLAMEFSQILKVPITFLGGAGSHHDINKLLSTVGIVGAAAASVFIFKGKHQAVLINYPTQIEKLQLCQGALVKKEKEFF